LWKYFLGNGEDVLPPRLGKSLHDVLLSTSIRQWDGAIADWVR